MRRSLARGLSLRGQTPMAQGLFGLPSMAPNLGTQPETYGGWFRAGYRFSLEKQLASLRHLFPAENLYPTRNRQACEL